jgi:hypothetical protein
VKGREISVQGRVTESSISARRRFYMRGRCRASASNEHGSGG